MRNIQSSNEGATMDAKNANPYRNLGPEEKAKAVFREMLPFALWAAIPLTTIYLIAKIFGPRIGT
jgi:hypothetical protein